MPIMRAINRIPGGLMVVPLFIGMLINTFAPHLLKIGGFTEGLSGAGYNTVLGMYLFTVGSKMTLQAAPRMLKRGFGIMFTKIAIAILISLAVAKFAGGTLFGFSTLALMVAFSDTNGGMFMALTSVMGDKEDVGTYVPQSIETGPFITMLFLVGAGLANIPYIAMVSVVAPIFVGAVLGNLDSDLRDFFGKHEPIIVPFMAFTLGQNINLGNVVSAGLSGVALGVFVCAITGILCIVTDKALGGTGIAGAAASSTAGNAAAVPKAIALADPSYAAIAPIATVQVAASVIVTAILTPLLTSWMHGRVQRRREAEAALPRVEPLSMSPRVLGETKEAF
jgi:2-keto-3-deoxygluconate permease